MGRINNKSKYTADLDLQPEDFLLGSKGVSLRTRNFLLSELTDFIGKHMMETAVETEAVFSDFVFGYTADGEVVRIPIGDFTGSLVGNLEGDYSDFAPEEGINEENYL